MTTPDILAARKLENSGMTRTEAEAVVGLIRTATAPLATNASLKAMEKSILDTIAAGKKSTLDRLESREDLIRADMRAMESRLLWRVAALNLTCLGILVAALRLFPV